MHDLTTPIAGAALLVLVIGSAIGLLAPAPPDAFTVDPDDMPVGPIVDEGELR